MEGLQLSETEQRYFSDLFLCCDADNSGRVPAYKASELFRSANLHVDVLKQIFELCGAGSHASHFGRRQFYTALKLVAASQAGLPLHSELVSSGLDVPLPRFTWAIEPVTDKHRPPPARHRISTSPDLIQLSDTDPTPTPLERQGTGGSGVLVTTSDSEAEAPTRTMPPPGSNGALSPEASSTASDSPTPTKSVQERGGLGPWSNSVHHHWQGLENEPGVVSEEARQLLGTEEESSDRHSSEDEGVGTDDVWAITPEQKDYYTAQFKALQPDTSALLQGQKARNFFEKSRLPVSELRKIWQLSDVTKDGALSLEEFNTAMHLVVLRRNSIPLPDILPPCLQPPLVNLATPPPSLPPTTEPPAPPRTEDSPPSLSPPTGEPTSPPRSKEWTKFVDSPTSSVSSPGPKPVNFDFHKSAVEQDPKILHPVPLRVTPDSQSLPACMAEEEALRSPRRLAEPADNVVNEQTSPKRAVAPPSLEPGDIRPIQRPQPKKPAAPGRGAIPPPPHSSILNAADEALGSGPTSLPMPQLSSLPQGPKKEPPPPPPPRPYRTHTRSSSLDLNTLGRSGGLLNAPPVVPPRVSPSTTSPKKLVGQRSEGDVISLVSTGQQQPGGFADFTQFGQDDLDAEHEEPPEPEQHPRRHGAFEVYRKPAKAARMEEDAVDSTARHRHKSDPSEALAMKGSSVASADLRDHNATLARLCTRLGRELVALQEEHIGLRLQLEALSPTD